MENGHRSTGCIGFRWLKEMVAIVRKERASDGNLQPIDSFQIKQARGAVMVVLVLLINSTGRPNSVPVHRSTVPV